MEPWPFPMFSQFYLHVHVIHRRRGPEPEPGHRAILQKGTALHVFHNSGGPCGWIDVVSEGGVCVRLCRADGGGPGPRSAREPVERLWGFHLDPLHARRWRSRNKPTCTCRSPRYESSSPKLTSNLLCFFWFIFRRRMVLCTFSWTFLFLFVGFTEARCGLEMNSKLEINCLWLCGICKLGWLQLKYVSCRL